MIYFLLSFDFYWTFRAHTPQLSFDNFLLDQMPMKTIHSGEFSNSRWIFFIWNCHAHLRFSINASWIFVGWNFWKTIEWNQSINRMQCDLTLWKIHKLFRCMFSSLPHNIISMCFNHYCSFEHKMPEISYVPSPLGVFRQTQVQEHQNQNTNTKAASASQDTSNNNTSQAVTPT